MAFITRVANVALPLGSPRRAHLVRAARGLGMLGPPASTDYQYWIENVEPYLFGPAIHLLDGDAHPSFSVVVPVYNGTPDRYLQPMVTSVINQSYGRWELIIADATTLPDRRAAVAGFRENELADPDLTFEESPFAVTEIILPKTKEVFGIAPAADLIAVRG